jgi:hypothetical protein
VSAARAGGATSATATAVPSINVSSAAASSAKPDTKREPIVDDGRLIDWRDDIVIRLGIDGLGARVALPVSVEIVPGGTSRRYLCNGGRAGPCPNGQSDEAW